MTRPRGLGEGEPAQECRYDEFRLMTAGQLRAEQALTAHNTPKCYLRCYLEPDCAEGPIS